MIRRFGIQMTRKPRRIVRKAPCGIFLCETEEGVCQIVVVEDADVVIDYVGHVQEDLGQRDLACYDSRHVYRI